MLAEQAIAEPCYGRPLRVARCFDGQIAFGVQPHGSICEVRRADTEPAIVDDENLGVDSDGVVSKARDCGVADTQAIERIGRTQLANRPESQRLDGVLFEPSGIPEWKDEDHLRTVWCLEPAAERIHDRRARQVLVLYVEVLARGVDQVK